MTTTNGGPPSGRGVYWFRLLVSALLVLCLTTGNGIQTVLQDGKMPSKIQMASALLLGVMAALNDVKSRITTS